MRARSPTTIQEAWRADGLRRRRCIKSHDRWVTTPIGTPLRITGTGDVYRGPFRALYAVKSPRWHGAAFIELRDGKVLRDTAIFGAPLDAQTWRTRWVEKT